METSTFTRAYLLPTIVFFLLIFPYSLLFIQTQEQIENLTVEDGIVENLSALFYFIASCICILVFIKSRSAEKIYFLKSRRNYFYLGLGLLFFFCAGEEISWGQRIIGISTTEWLADHNLQGETNLHNLKVLYAKDRSTTGEVQLGLSHWLSPEGILILFWLGFCLFIPTINALSQKVRNFTGKIYFPLVPLWVGLFFVLNQAIYTLFKAKQLFPVHPMAEFKETNCAFLFMVASFSLYMLYKKNTQPS
ncbi:hypothetical protein [Haliscomenobacter sp.]|uniref:hypothetical protein n=1 Tax=Haliscomenobacter sp. TaxID=2717303 RepID=UPI003BACF8C3